MEIGRTRLPPRNPLALRLKKRRRRDAERPFKVARLGSLTQHKEGAKTLEARMKNGGHTARRSKLSLLGSTAQRSKRKRARGATKKVRRAASRPQRKREPSATVTPGA